MEENYKVGDIVCGVISGIQPYGAFVNFENRQQGLIHISEVSMRYVKNIDSYLYVGQKVRVKIISVDENSNFLRVSLKQLGERERQVIRKPLIITKTKRKIIKTTDEDFKVLQDALPQWIEKALKEKKYD